MLAVIGWAPLAWQLVGDSSTWFWTMVQAVAVLVTLLGILRQVRLQSEANVLATLQGIEERWESQELVEARLKVARDVIAGRLEWGKEAARLTRFFETLGMYLRRKVFSVDLVWDLYSMPAEYLWQGLHPMIEYIRRQDATAYTNFEYLYARFAEQSRKAGHPCVRHTQAQLLNYFDSQISILTAAPPEQGERRIIWVPAVYPESGVGTLGKVEKPAFRYVMVRLLRWSPRRGDARHQKNPPPAVERATAFGAQSNVDSSLGQPPLDAAQLEGVPEVTP